MNEIELTRGLAYSDLIRSYNVFVDDVLFGTLKSNEKKVIKTSRDHVKIRLAVDWCRSKELDLHFDENQKKIRLRVMPNPQNIISAGIAFLCIFVDDIFYSSPILQLAGILASVLFIYNLIWKRGEYLRLYFSK